ncbi:hypothetical protein T265_04025 [Opisthorchis viverrini]|uniref:Uncharacterized protein n=1 Tax=Opisthorchis viverrini TaxID=6198 RepID=A0A074ZPM6_OPIVI|nr:hypothetical protein T265_04025 [Opisthorchis viverrini]KER29373.1 hypothetical protein T265_04025 [Opisthorchis viverrini]
MRPCDAVHPLLPVAAVVDTQTGSAKTSLRDVEKRECYQTVEASISLKKTYMINTSIAHRTAGHLNPAKGEPHAYTIPAARFTSAPGKHQDFQGVNFVPNPTYASLI